MKPQLRPNNASASFLFLSYACTGAQINKSTKKSVLLQCENIVLTKTAICKIFLSEMQTVKFKEHKNEPVTMSLSRELTYKLKCF